MRISDWSSDLCSSDLALSDSLTALANRKNFEQTLTLFAKAAQDNHEPLALMLLDIDHFKLFNDRYGHQTGDTVLQLVARTLSDTDRKSDGRENVCQHG